ncbi:MAG TPA: hypothetical protein DCS17_02970 [Flavobacterium sp.]|nr:hypothetical protein [Flavobacterium sp.]
MAGAKKTNNFTNVTLSVNVQVTEVNKAKVIDSINSIINGLKEDEIIILANALQKEDLKNFAIEYLKSQQ